MGYPIYHSTYTAAQIEAAIGKGPRVNTSGYWEVWNVGTGAYESTGVGAGVTPPTVVTQVSQMANHGYIYIYNGTETGYTAGYWYYWDGSAWTAGGAYQVAATDTTLTVAGAAADAKATGDKLGELKSALGQITGNDVISFITKKYITLSGATADITNMVTPTGNCNCAVVECSEGDKFVIFARGGAGARAWGFINNNNGGQILEVEASGVSRFNYVVTAPENATHLIINDNNLPPSISYKGDGLLIDNYEGTVAELEKDERLSKYAYKGSNSEQTNKDYSFIKNVQYTGNILLNKAISSAGGSVVSQNGCILTDDFIPLASRIIPLNGYYYNLITYSDQGVYASSSGFVNTPKWLRTDKKYKIVVKRTNDSTEIIQDEINNIVLASYEATDELKWVNGVIGQDGATNDSNTVIRTYTYIPETIIGIGVMDYSYRFAIASYNKSTGAFVNRTSFGRKYTVLDHSSYKYILLMNKSDDSNVTQDIVSNLFVNDGNLAGIPLCIGYISDGGAIAAGQHTMYTPGYVPEYVTGVSTKYCNYIIGIARWNKSNGNFVDRSAFNGAPYFNFDHSTYKYRVSIVTYDNSAVSVFDRDSIVQFYSDFDAIKPFAYSVGISDMEKFLSGDGTQVAVDNDRGMVYCLYNAGRVTYGEAYSFGNLAVFPIHQPFRVQFYKAWEYGETYGNLTVHGVQDTNVILGDGFVRVMFYETVTECYWYRDFDLSTKEYGNAVKMQFKTSAGATAVDFSKTNVKAFYDDNSLTWNGNPTIASRLFEKDGDIYGILMPTIAVTKPLFVKTEDSGATFEVVNIVPINGQIECAIAYTDRWYIVARNGSFYYSNDDFETATVVGNSSCITCDGTRPDMFVDGDDVVVCTSNTRTSWSSSLHHASRTNIKLYKGHGTDISKYKLLYLLINPHGCCYYRIINYKGVLYYIGTCGELYPDKHSGDAQCKDGVYYIKLGFEEALI